MKSIIIIFLMVFVAFPFTISAQSPITYGTLQVHSSDSLAASPTETYHFFAISSPQNNLRAQSNYPRGNEELLNFFPNRLASGTTYTFNLTQDARGDLLVDGGGCQNSPFAHPDQPLSTQFVMSLADFRVPKFPKVSSTPNATVDVTVPFTMTGRVSCLGTGGGLVFTIPVSGAGNALLRFKRGATWNRVYVIDAMYNFGNYPLASPIE